MKKKLFTLIGIILFCAPAARSFAGDASAIYEARCAACHGKDRKGNPAMATDPDKLDLTDRRTLSKSDERLARKISYGDDDMPGFRDQLSAEEIRALVSYIKNPQGEAGKNSSCEYEENCECTVPGITLRWKAVYCMQMEETGDFHAPGVQRCLYNPDPKSLGKVGSCRQNAYWKKMFCRALYKNDKHRIQGCVQDKKMIPGFVKSGPES